MLPGRKKFKLDKNSDEILRHEALRGIIQWVGSGNKTVNLVRMDTNHIKNAIAKFQRGELPMKEGAIMDLINEKMYREVHQIGKLEKPEKTNGRRTLITGGENKDSI
tara:strand:+ start:29 stop:349 length:321 start_codon:yes stop_codon:yes gene_type:complete